MYITTIASLLYMGVFAFQQAAAGTKVAGNIIAGVIAFVLIICALILGWDGWQAIQRARAGKPAEV
jgi:protein-S-isoprenylcysteine O-methyltransferase Ste14